MYADNSDCHPLTASYPITEAPALCVFQIKPATDSTAKLPPLLFGSPNWRESTRYSPSCQKQERLKK